VARTYKTLSLSMPPDAVEKLTAIGKRTRRVAARVAADIVLLEVAKDSSTTKESTRQKSWCCQARVVPIKGPLVIIDSKFGMKREWLPVIVLLCEACKKQMHGHEYEGWIGDA
jgi:hypothetical protein